MGTTTEQAPEIAPGRALLTSRARRWATRQAGRGRLLTDIAAELGCAWHTVNTSLRRWGQALLAADADRVGAVQALGLDETLFARRGRYRAKAWSTNIVDVGRGQLLDVVPGRTAKAPVRHCSHGPSSGARRSVGRHWTCLAPTAPRSTPRCHRPARSRIRSTS